MSNMKDLRKLRITRRTPIQLPLHFPPNPETNVLALDDRNPHLHKKNKNIRKEPEAPATALKAATHRRPGSFATPDLPERHFYLHENPRLSM